jgi:hypothetical protein
MNTRAQIVLPDWVTCPVDIFHNDPWLDHLIEPLHPWQMRRLSCLVGHTGGQNFKICFDQDVVALDPVLFHPFSFRRPEAPSSVL